jgi:hypothetical protein
MVVGAPPRVEDRQSHVAAPEENLVALFGRLKDEIRHAHGANVSDASDRGFVRSRLRPLAEKSWIVRFARPLERRPGVRGTVLYPVKLCLGRLIRWYVEPFAGDQRTFNDAILKLETSCSRRWTRSSGGSGSSSWSSSSGGTMHGS